MTIIIFNNQTIKIAKTIIKIFNYQKFNNIDIKELLAKKFIWFKYSEQ
jgi:hypothetical protein